MIAAANRIICDSIELEKDKKRRRLLKLILRLGIPFVLGVCVSVLILAVF